MESILIYGLIEGLMIALVALALSMIYSGLRILDISVGGVYVAASYFMLFALTLLESSEPLSVATIMVAVILTIGLCLVLSGLIEKAVYLPFFRKKAGSMTGLIAGLALFTAIINVIAMIAGTETKMIPVPGTLAISYKFGSVIITGVQLIQFLASIIILAAAVYFLKKTSLGRKIVALSDNPVQFQAIGLKVAKTRLTIMLFAAVLLASGSILKSIDIGIDPFSSGFNIVLVSAVAMILGGVTNFYGVIAGGVILGILMNLTAWLLPGEWKMAVVFLVLILLLMFKREGFFTQRLRLEEQQ